MQDTFVEKASISYGQHYLPYLQGHILNIIEKNQSDRIFLEDNNHKITYFEFWLLSRKLAAYLSSQGIKCNDLVAIYLPRSIWQWVTVTALWIVGAHYLPLDRRWNPNKLCALLTDANCDFIIAEAQPPFDTQCPKISFTPESIADLYPAPINYSDSAYMIATSGSTGMPKLILNTHRGLFNMANCLLEMFCISEQQCILQYAPLCFDASIIEFAMCVTAGASCVVLTEQENAAGEQLSQFLIAKKIQITLLPPSIAATLSNQALEQLDILILGGEGSNSTQLEKFLSKTQVFNAYGLSEAAAVTTIKSIKHPNKDLDIIGQPFKNTAISIVNQNNQIAATNEIGEIVLHGIGVCNGYLQTKTLTETQQAKFFINNSMIEPYHKSLRTGDLGVMLPTGEVKFLGRNDDQIKRLGNRFSIVEVQNMVCEIPEVNDCRIAVDNNKKLIAFVIADASLTPDELFKQFRNIGPSHMCPNEFILIEKFPVSENGKVDINTLLSKATQNLIEKEHIDPNQKFKNIWQNVLNYPDNNVNNDDNFFKQGGDSLTAIELTSQLGKAFNIEMSTLDIFDNPTFAALNKKVCESYSSISIPTEPQKEKAAVLLGFDARQLYLWNKVGKDQTLNRVVFHFTLTGKINYQKFKTACHSVFQHHELLRAQVVDNNNQPQWLIKKHELEILEYDLRGQSSSKTTTALEMLYAEHNEEIFDPRCHPAFKLIFIQKLETEYHIYMPIYHLISDVNSIQIIWDDIIKAYYEKTLPSHHDFAEHISREYHYLTSDKFFEDKQYFQKIGLQEGCVQIAKNFEKSFITNEFELDLSEGLANIEKLASTLGCSSHAILLTCFAAAIQTVFSQQNFCIGIPIATRKDSFYNNMIGPFNTRLPLFCNYDNSRSFADNCLIFFREVNELRRHCLIPRKYLQEIKNNWYNIIFDMEHLMDFHTEDFVIEQHIIPDYAQMSHFIFARAHQTKDSLSFIIRYRIDLLESNAKEILTAKILNLLQLNKN